MTTVTGKFQITLPKRLVDAYGINVGDDVELVASGDTIILIPASAKSSGPTLPLEERLRHFDEATERQRERERKSPRAPLAPGEDRGWTRDELYEERINRGRSG